MFDRTLRPELIARAGRHRVVAVVGPRQSGKTTLCTLAFPDKPVVRLEAVRERELASADPASFLARFPVAQSSTRSSACRSSSPNCRSSSIAELGTAIGS